MLDISFISCILTYYCTSQWHSLKYDALWKMAKTVFTTVWDIALRLVTYQRHRRLSQDDSDLKSAIEVMRV